MTDNQLGEDLCIIYKGLLFLIYEGGCTKQEVKHNPQKNGQKYEQVIYRKTYVSGR